MTSPRPDPALRFASSVDELSALEPLWNALHEHHSEITPSLGGTPRRELADAWRKRRTKYERWLEDPDTFFVVAENGGSPIGYAFVTVGPGYASWQTGERLAELETLSVLPAHRGDGVGTALVESVLGRLAEIGVEDLAVTSTATNVDAHRFYEGHGFTQGFVVHYRRGAR
jgi:GNAT superfamily N-acetyltransferase